MFESFEAEEKSRGVKGFLARHFGPVVHLDLAEEGIREIGIIFMCLAALSAVVGLVVHHNVVYLVAAIILAFVALVAFMLYLTKSRAAAVFLLVLSLLNALLTLAFLPWVWVAFSARAIQLTFGYHRLMKEKRETAVALSALD